MTEPTEKEVFRATITLLPFVQRRCLSLNPEDIEEFAYDVLQRACGTHDPGGPWSQSSSGTDTRRAIVRAVANHDDAWRG
jgi:hypothetical protein